MTASVPAVLDDLSVVVPALGHPVLEQCLDSTAAGSRRPACLVLVGQGPNPEVARWVERLRARSLAVEYLHFEQRGVAAARNRGMGRVGPFEETASLNGAEDNDWGYRALRLGVPIIYAPEVAVTHLDWRDVRQLRATYRRYARAQGGFYGKHLHARDLYIAGRALRDVIRGPWLVLRAAVTGNPELAVIARAEAAGILPGIVAGYRDGRRR